MKAKFCCNNWLALVPSIQETKALELGKVEPAYLVKPVLDMLNNIDLYCPVCGEGLKEDTDKGLPEPVKTVKKEKAPSPPPRATVPCYACKGKLRKKDETTCLVCLGTNDSSKGANKTNSPTSL